MHATHHIRLFLWCSILFLLPAQSPAGQGAGLRQVGTIPLPRVEGRIDHMAYDGRSGLLYVAALGNNTVEVVDTRAGRVIHTITGLGEPQGIAVLPEGDRFFVANAKDGSCRIFDAASYRQLGSIDLKDDADNVRADGAAHRIYVGYGDGALAVIDGRTGAHLADVRLAAHPESFQLEKTGDRIFINLPEANGSIAVVDRKSAKVIQTWHLDVARANFPMALDEAGHRLFIGCRQPAKLVVVDTESGKTVDAIDCVGDTDDVWFDAAAGRVYVSGGEGFVSVVGPGSGGRLLSIARVPTAAGARTSLFRPDSGMLYVAVPHRRNQPAEIRVFATR